MLKRPRDGNTEETREPKRPKVEYRAPSVRVWTTPRLVGSNIAPFLRTSEVNNLLLTCKRHRENLDTDCNAWSPALQINQPDDIPSIADKTDKTYRFIKKISRKLRAVDINLGDAEIIAHRFGHCCQVHSYVH